MSEENWPAFGTDDVKVYRFRELHGHTLRFQVKAAHDCLLAFTDGPEETEQMFEVFIGGWEGQESAIRQSKGDDLVRLETPDILSEDEFREFWVAFDNNEVRVGRGEEWEPFMMAALPSPCKVTHYGYSTGWGASGWWKFYNDRMILTEDDLTYKYEPIYGNTITFRVACNNDAHISLASAAEDTDPMYQVFIGGWENAASAIRVNNDEDAVKVDTPSIVCSNNMRTFWIHFAEGNIRVGVAGNQYPFMEWADSSPWKVTHLGYRTGWGSEGKWKFEV